jgi:hypothetical protein
MDIKPSSLPQMALDPKAVVIHTAIPRNQLNEHDAYENKVRQMIKSPRPFAIWPLFT